MNAPDQFRPDPCPSVEAARLEMLRTEIAADYAGALDIGGPVPKGHPAYAAEQEAIAAHAAYWAALKEAEAQ
jgi:hypothetical protein